MKRSFQACICINLERKPIVYYENKKKSQKELGMLFSKGGKLRSGIGNQTKKSRSGSKFQMLVEDVWEEVLVTLAIRGSGECGILYLAASECMLTIE
ncbi:hypothetical protein CsatB_009902 [Cannabis sativa]